MCEIIIPYIEIIKNNVGMNCLLIERRRAYYETEDFRKNIPSMFEELHDRTIDDLISEYNPEEFRIKINGL